MAFPRARLRVLAVATLIVLWHWWAAVDLIRVFGLGPGDYGFYSIDSIVTRVEPGGAADRAGVRVGDRITPTGKVSEYSLVRGISRHAGDVLSATIASPARTVRIELRADGESASTRGFVALRFILSYLTVGVATALLLTRPDPAAWGFFLYCLCAISLPGAVLSMALPTQLRTVDQLVSQLIYDISLAGGVLFAWMFSASQWSRQRLAIVGIAFAAAVSTWAIEVHSALPATSRLSDIADDAFSALILLAMFGGFIDSYRRDSGATRQRLKWMIAALIVSVPARYIASWFFPGHLSYNTYVSLIAIQAVLPLAAAYAMFRRRVVDVNFVISRTVVYATLTALLVAILSVVDALFSHAMAATRVSFGAELALAILLGLSLNAAHRRIDSLIDRFLFWERHHAEQRLRSAALTLVHATEKGTVMKTLLHLPVEALKLTGAAFYHFSGSAFVRAEVTGDLVHLPQTIDREDPLVLQLQTDLQPKRLGSSPASKLNGRTAVLALPVAMRGVLNGFAIYGAHSNGADIDPDEQKSLAPLATSAASALDHLDAQALRSRVAVLEAMLGGQLTTQ